MTDQLKTNPDAPFDQDEQELANLITNLADQHNRGIELQLEAVCRSHPKFADDLRELWGTMVVTQVATSAALDEMKTGPYNHGSEAIATQLELPCEMGGYFVEEEIGRGGMGIVYRAVRLADGENVALKMILKGDFASQADRERFQAEAEAAVRLNHPNIVPIYEIGELQGRAFFCMKLIEGQTLADRLSRGPVPGRRAAQWLGEIAEAIHYAHGQGVLHRDLKPSNILIDHDGVPFVADFGLAKRDFDRVSLTKSGAVLGTPSYMSPEQAAGRRGQVGKVSDVYSLGAILYHMLTGRPPFLAASPVDTVLMVLEQDPIPPRALNRRADRNLEMICMRCLQKPQDLRYASAGLLAQDLSAYLNAQPISATEGRLGKIVANVFRETHHADVLENWGMIWMWHSLVLLVASFGTNLLHWQGDTSRLHYWMMWTLGLGTWAVVFWMIRRRMGPVTFVERQIAHVWASSMCCVVFLFPLESALGLEVLALAPLLAVVAGMVFVIKAGILSGSFYIQAAVMFATAIFMTLFSDFAMFLFGIAAGACFFFAGLKYYRRRKTTGSMSGVRG